MGEFVRKFTQLNGKIATIILEHCWFGKQRFKVDCVSVLEDDKRLGLILHRQAVYVYKQSLKFMNIQEGIVEFADDKLKISIKF